MNLVPLKDIPESLIEFNRERVKSEVAQAIFELMRFHHVNRKSLSELLDVNKSLVSRMLSGGNNFTLERIADILLVLKRTPHFVLGTEIEKIRFPVDEGSLIPSVEKSGTTVANTRLSPDGNYSLASYANKNFGNSTWGHITSVIVPAVAVPLGELG